MARVTVALWMSTIHKLLTSSQLPAWREALRQSGKRLVVTNGCFDLLHVGHVHYLEQARALGDALLIGGQRGCQCPTIEGT